MADVLCQRTLHRQQNAFQGHGPCLSVADSQKRLSFAVINITVDTASVDVNVHPQKSEIKFSDDSLIYKAMYKALTDALTKPMSAQKTQVTLLPDSELNVFVKPQPQAVSVPVTPVPQPKPAYQPQQPVFKGGAEQIFKTPERRKSHRAQPSQCSRAAQSRFSKRRSVMKSSLQQKSCW